MFGHIPGQCGPAKLTCKIKYHSNKDTELNKLSSQDHRLVLEAVVYTGIVVPDSDLARKKTQITVLDI